MPPAKKEDPMVEDEEGSDDDSSDSDSEDSDFEVDEQDMGRIMQLEAQLEGNASLYDGHTQYIGLLRKNRLKQRLRDARQRMHKLFPLTEQQWLEWVQDEQKDLRAAEDVARLRSLYQAATQDYLSVPIWVSYLSFLKDVDPQVGSGSAEGQAVFREAAEAALAAAGLHVAAGGQLLAAYRSYEQGLAEAGTRGGGFDKLRALYQRQLAVPLAGNEAVLQEYQAWEPPHGGSVPAAVLVAAKAAQEAVALRAAHEAAVAADKAPDAHLLAGFLAYIKLETAQGDPARVQAVYERAVAAFPVTAELWARYTRYLAAQLGAAAGAPGGPLQSVYARAVRNCPWVGSLWAGAMRALDRSGAAPAEAGPAHEALYTQAVAAGLQGAEDYMEVLLARADVLRRAAFAGGAAADAGLAALRAHFRSAMQLMAQYWPDYVDRGLRLPAYWAHCEGRLAGDAAAAAGVWESALKGVLGRHAEAWIAYAASERSARRLAQARAVYRKGVGKKLEEAGAAALALDWLRFEREEGSAEELYQAQVKTDPLLEEAQAAAAAMANSHAVALAREAAAQAPQLSREEMKALRRANDPNYKQGKKGSKRDRASGAAEEDAAPSKRSKEAHAPAADGDGDVGMHDADGQAGHADAAVGEGGAAAPSGDGAAHPPGDGQQQEARPHYTDQHTVFVRGLGDTEADLEPGLRQLLASCGEIKGVRIPLAGTMTKGFAYVEFATDEGVRAAEALQGPMLGARRLTIMRSAPPGAGGGRGRGHGGRDGGRGRGGSFGGGRGRQQDGGGGGRGFGGGRGRQQDGGGRGRGGLGYGARGGQPKTHGNMGHMRKHLQTGEGGGGEEGPRAADGWTAAVPGASGMMMKPRAVASKGAAGGDGAPKSNDDFRKMLLGGGKPAADKQG